MYTNTIIKTTLMTLTMVLFSACTPNTPYRINTTSNCTDKTDCVLEKHENYEVGFIEFSERGNLFNVNAKELIFNKIKSYSKSDEGVLVIVFVHGWKHNASSEDSNVQSFKAVLKKISHPRYNKKNLNNRKVVGVYLGWRGLTISGLGSDNLTFWDRKEVAEEVGKGGVTEVLLGLEQLDAHNDNNILMTVGHSFGAAITLSALNETLLERLITKKFNPSKPLKHFGDGVILINPAIEANQIFQLYEASQNLKQSKNNKKILHIISSEGDLATKYAFPAGQFFDKALTWNQANIQRTYAEKNYTISEYDLDLTTIGNFMPFHTANLIDDNDKTTLFFAEHNETIGKWRYKNCCNNPKECTLSNDAKYKLPCSQSSPLSFLYTSKSFIHNHNDIFNDNVLAYLSSVISESLHSKGKGNIGECVEDNNTFNFGKCFNSHKNKIIKE